LRDHAVRPENAAPTSGLVIGLILSRRLHRTAAGRCAQGEPSFEFTEAVMSADQF
jgi:hypothetical protein